MFSKPLIDLNIPGLSLDLYKLFETSLYKISLTSVLLPLPDTPVTHMNLPSGNLTLTFFKLFSLAPTISKYFLLPFLLFLGTSILSSPVKYLPVKLLGLAITSLGVPSATTLPP